MIELDEDARAQIARKALSDPFPKADIIDATIDAVLSHLNTPEAPDAYLVLARKCAALPSAAHGYASLAAEYRNGELDAELTTAADYLRKRDERLIEAIEPYREQSYFGGPIIARLKAEMAKS